MRHILDLITEFGDFSAELSDLAEVVIESATNICLQPLLERYGSPRLDDGNPCQFSVCALGKCGGRELGFASDIELMFLYEGTGKTEGPESITTSEFFQHLVEQFKQTIRARQEGIFQLDLRLRPYGRAGSLAVSKEAFEKYFSHDGPAWPYERQALVKLRHVCGDEKFGHAMTIMRDELIYHGPPFDAAAMRAMREKQVRQLVKGSTLNAKLSPGGLVDIEYLVQGLQINYGRANHLLRSSNTRKAIQALHLSGILSPENFEKLRAAHMFQRKLIDALRMVRGNAKDLTVPPVDSEEFEFLARRLGYQSNTIKLKNDLEESITNVLEISRALM
ncbi:MAG: glutamine synthetase adenylyltransferase, partial [Planctomycetaceae bacterium]|nr:glutamine synthetase adenylyltransferase [Planctomycetaceae bacterium]